MSRRESFSLSLIWSALLLPRALLALEVLPAPEVLLVLEVPLALVPPLLLLALAAPPDLLPRLAPALRSIGPWPLSYRCRCSLR
jgi:hypothetical protein